MAPTPPITLPDGLVFAYYVSHEAYYADAVTHRQPEIMVAAVNPEGGARWEFGVRQHDLGSIDAIRVEVFDDAFAAFTQARPFFDALAAERPSTLAEVRTILDRLGAMDQTARTAPSGGAA
jgi:hypothetical protein